MAVPATTMYNAPSKPMNRGSRSSAIGSFAHFIARVEETDIDQRLATVTRVENLGNRRWNVDVCQSWKAIDDCDEPVRVVLRERSDEDCVQ
jgi:hypothetical protein